MFRGYVGSSSLQADEVSDKDGLSFKHLAKIQEVVETIKAVESISGFCPYTSEKPAWYIVVGKAPSNSFCLSSFATSDKSFISGEPLP